MLEARIGPDGVQLSLKRRAWWRPAAADWQERLAVPTRRDDAPAALHAALAKARRALAEAGIGWPRAIAIEIDDVWVRHAAVQGEFCSMSRAAIDAATQAFFARALGQDASELALCMQPQPDGRSMWVACMPAALRDGLACAARDHRLALRALRPGLQRYVRPQRRWPRDGVLVVAHAEGVLIACRRGGSWVALANELRGFDAAVVARAEALCRFHGIALEVASRWAALPADRALPAGWTRVPDAPAALRAPVAIVSLDGAAGAALEDGTQAASDASRPGARASGAPRPSQREAALGGTTR